MVGYIPLAPTTSPLWETGYFAPTGTVDLQAAAALAPDVTAGEAALLPRSISINANGLPLLESRPNGAGLELFLDFSRDDGTYGTFSLDSDRANFNFAEELTIYSCWRGVASFFSQFNVNVTDVLPATGASDPNFAWIQVTNEFSGGAAYVNSLTKSGPTGHVNSGNATDRISGIVHEFGHILGLGHQSNWDKYGNLTAEYSNGDGYRNVPIMGIDYNGQPNSRWWYGRADWASGSGVIQDDVQWIANTIAGVVGGDGMRPDDYGDTLGTAYALPAGSQALDGYLERTTDVDYFKITPTSTGDWDFTATPLYGSQAQPKLELLDSSGNVIAAHDDASYRNGPTNEQFLNISLAPGTYYVRVTSSGDYDELGYYKFAATQLPSYFVSNDVGIPALDGTVTYDSSTGIFTQSGGGTDIWNTSDQFRYTYETLTGDGSITARVDGLDNIGSDTKAGIMIRQSLDANSAHGYIGLIPNGSVETIWRSAAGATAANVGATASGGPWIRLTRSGNTFTFQTSTDGSSWTTVGTTNITMTGPVLIGLATCAWSSRYEAFATFSNVSVTGNITPTSPTYDALPSPATFTATPASGANTSINLAWSAVAGATGYRIERSVDGINFSTLTSVGSGVTTYTDANVWGSMRWFYRVEASDGTTLYSPPASANTVNKPNAPGTPGYTAAVIGIGTTELDLNWLDVQGETGYRVEYSSNGGSSYTTAATLAANATSYNLTGLATGTAYRIRITPLTSIGDGVAPPLVFDTETRMAAPANLRFTAKSSTSMTIAWTDANLETGVRIERSTDGVNFTTLTTAAQNTTTYTDNGLTAGTEYYYRVTQVDSTFDGFSGTIFAAAPAASLPSGWAEADVGTVAGSGAAVSSTGTSWTLVSSGTDIAGSADSFHFAYKTFTTNTTIIARVDTLENTDNAAKAGVMIRQDLTAGSKFIAMMMNAGGGYGIDLRTRTTANTNYTYQQVLANVTAPYWLKLTRSGTSILTAYSTDGITWTSGSTISLSLTGTFYVGLAGTAFSSSFLNTSTFSNVGIGTSAPTVATAAAANPNPTSGTTINLTVLGADAGGEATLTYTWSTTGTPPAAVNLSANGTNAAKNTTATFSKAGSYSFLVTITNSSGLQTTSSVSVTVNQTLSGIVAATPTMAVGMSQQISLADQFGAALVSPPAVTWSASAGSITTGGVYTAPGTAAPSVTITGQTASGTFKYYLAVSDPLAWYKADESSGTTLADATAGARTGALTTTYNFTSGISGNAVQLTGGYASLPASIVSAVSNFTIATWIKADSLDTWSRIFDFGTGTTANMFLTPSAGGTNKPRFAITTSGGGGEQQLNSNIALATGTWYHIAVTLSGNTGTLYINGAVVATNTGMTLHPSSLGSTTQNYLGKSQYADPAFLGSIDDFRLYGRALSASEVLNLTKPTVITAAASGASPVTTTSTTLSALGMDQTVGESALTYTWATTGTPPATVGYSVNGTNGAKNTVATFTKAGTYNFSVTITNPRGVAAASAISVTVNQTLISIAVTPSSVTLAANATQQFSASGYDQFGNVLISQPSFTWSLAGFSDGTVDNSGKYTAPVTHGAATVQAISGSVTGSASVTVTGPPKMTQALSRKMQGGNPFDLTLPLAGVSAIESRQDGPTALILTFDQTLDTSSTLSLTLSSGTGSASYLGSNQVSVGLSGATDGQVLSVTVGGVKTAGGPAGSYTLNIGVLAGDVDGSGAVNVADVITIKLRSGAALDATNFLADLNGDGSINVADTITAKLNSGHVLVSGGAQTALMVEVPQSASVQSASAPAAQTENNAKLAALAIQPVPLELHSAAVASSPPISIEPETVLTPSMTTDTVSPTLPLQRSGASTSDASDQGSCAIARQSIATTSEASKPRPADPVRSHTASPGVYDHSIRAMIFASDSYDNVPNSEPRFSKRKLAVRSPAP